MVRSSISNTIPKSQAPLLKAPSGPSGDELNFLVLQRARQVFLSFAFPLFQASGDNNTKDFFESQELFCLRPKDAGEAGEAAAGDYCEIGVGSELFRVGESAA